MEIDEPPLPQPLAAPQLDRLRSPATGVADVQPIAHFRDELDAQRVLAAARLPALLQPRCRVGAW